MTNAEKGREHTYQWLLRALGAYLDEQSSCRISLVEVPEGFVVRLQRNFHQLEPLNYLLRREDLRERLEQLPRSKGPKMPIRHQGIWSRFPSGHQDCFRALGFELDDTGARRILLDELEDQLVLSYQTRDEEREGGWRKQMLVLSEQDVETVLNAAFARRGQPTH
ncbi:MAG: hypothetical protein ACRDFS_08815 [Chloroflexota bacterium]